MADLDKIMTALRNAHAAGDTAAAKRLAAMAKAAQSPESPAMSEGRAKLSGMTQNPDVQPIPRSTGQALYDNLIGDPNDGVDSTGEKIGRTIGDMGKAAGAGLARGTAGLVGLPGTASDAVDAGLTYVGKKAGIIPQEWQAPRASAVSGAKLTGAMSATTGGATDFKGETLAGKMAGTAAEFLPGALALGPKTVAGAVQYALAPGVASETAGRFTEGTKAEPWARLVAALAAPMALSGLPAGARAAAGLPRSAADPERLKLAKVLDDFGVPVTAGQRTGAKALRKVEGATGAADDVFAGQADDFTAIGAEQNHGWIAAHLEPAAELLRRSTVPIDIHGYEKLGTFDKILPVENCGLDLIAIWAPHCPPVQKQRFVGFFGQRKRGIDIAGMPIDTSG